MRKGFLEGGVVAEGLMGRWVRSGREGRVGKGGRWMRGGNEGRVGVVRKVV